MKWLVFAAALVGIGCATPQNAVQQALVTSARALREVDRSFAPRYKQAAQVSLRASDTAEEYQRRMAPWERGADSIRGSRDAIAAAGKALQAGVAAASHDFGKLASCVVAALGELVASMGTLGIPVPDLLLELLAAFAEWAGDACLA